MGLRCAGVKRRDLIRHLLALGCCLQRHGSEHDMWINPANHKESSVPRHREIKFPTAKSICKDLGIPAPQGKR